MRQWHTPKRAKSPPVLARDGSDGAFALTTEINAQNNEVALRLS